MKKKQNNKKKKSFRKRMMDIPLLKENKQGILLREAS